MPKAKYSLITNNFYEKFFTRKTRKYQKLFVTLRTKTDVLPSKPGYFQMQGGREEGCEEDQEGSKKKWMCEYCTYSNWQSSTKCTMCRGKKPVILCSSENIYSAANTNSLRGEKDTRICLLMILTLTPSRHVTSCHHKLTGQIDSIMQILI